ncbi:MULTISPECIES: MmcQ/YjbR family DNA-binding protein [unclassified Amycolatopsis]|uniref:MmcQ/YjbR family DNA-binding protein n=1 Tax=unclassified Amycolatopsis TaxID=2618356 RepID=UPI002874A4F6|nr:MULTISPECIES: MmcQ/YjbR family DNA-binding protein [unclassified Amycolatopsis]MDS0139577.1 MmcQ/YjbR family DNA-binding protein [Amycolatopsis sp. 505]MDS0147156.1 MmcQ/YjbR family DNA-binding protein [Amycolatopsis sp. CM201R]
MVTGDDVRAFASTLPRAYEAVVRDRIKFRVGQIVFVALSADETLMGFAFPREQREALIAGEPGKFLLPEPSDLRFRWVRCRLAAIDLGEMRELVVEAWRMCVPKKVWTEYLETHPL